jgi:predicted DNA-binding transcriptional regulator YafY
MPDQPQTAAKPKGRMFAHLSVTTRKITFTYRNWRGETAVRTAEPTGIWFGSSEWHPEPQWIMSACDTEKNVMRYFAMRDMKDVNYAE